MRWRLRIPLMAALACALPGWAAGAEPEGAHGQVMRYPFTLPAQPLADALAALSRLTGQNIAYTDERIPGLRAPAVNGQLSVEQALSQLLEGTPLVYRRVDARTLALSDGGDTHGGGLIQLQPLTIEARNWAGYQADPVVRASHAGTPWVEQAQAISRVPNAVLRDQQPRNLDDALRTISGVTQGNTLGSTQDTLMKRGFGDNRDGAILRDGMPSIQGRNFNATTDTVEVLKGPTALLYGIQDPGGMINVVSKVPQLTAHHELQSKASGVAHGRDGAGLSLDSTGPLGNGGVAYRLIVDRQDERYWRNYGAHRETLFAPSLAWYGEHDELKLALEQRTFLTPFDRGTALDPTTNKPLAIPYDRRLDEPFNDMQGRSQMARLNYDHHFDDTWQLHSALSYNQERYDAYQVRITGVDPTQGTLARSLDATLGSNSHDRQAYAEVAGSPEWLGLRHDLLLGLVDEHRLYFRENLIRQASTSTFNYLNPVYGQAPVPTAVSASDSDQRDRLRTSALYLRDAVHLNAQWTATLGGRLLTYDQYAGRGRPFQANTDISGSAVVPSAGLLYQFAPQWSWYVSYSESLKPNSSIAPLNAASAQVIDSTIRPEQAKAWETGLKFEAAEGLSASLALYDIRKRNILVSELVDGLPVSRNAGAVRSRGVEVEASGRLAEGWDLMAAYALTDAWVSHDPRLAGNRLQNVPRQSASLYLSHDLGPRWGADRLRVGGGPHYVSARPGDPANSFDLPAYTVTDLFARYDTRVAGYAVQLQLNINNLFDKHYYPSAVNRNLVSVGDPRQWVLATSVEF